LDISPASLTILDFKDMMYARPPYNDTAHYSARHGHPGYSFGTALESVGRTVWMTKNMMPGFSEKSGI
jgi:hypothetical protein